MNLLLDDMADKMSEPYGSPDRGIKEDLGIQISSTELLEHHREIQGTQEHGYSPDEDQQIQRPMEQPLPASTPHLESTHMSDHLSSQQAGIWKDFCTFLCLVYQRELWLS